MPQTSASVHRIVEQNGEFLVSFHEHDGYFKIPESPQATDLREMIKAALQSGQPVAFSYDAELNILSIV